ncbi:MAG: hypothetical protein M0R74_13575, partial [Dehalococcoidia bacterium]|nr:hypothetical protein [Dehalococcoidia bacterium]
MPADFVTELRQAFSGAYNEPPAVVVRAPGRVNLIGEHTDYSHLPVLPIAIDRALYIAAAPSAEPVVEVRSAQFEPSAVLTRDGPARRETGWHGYVAGVLNELRDVASGRGARVFITGDLPPASGLSSSSALSVGLMAALNGAWEGGLEAPIIAHRAAAAERHVGVETGGMDQTVITFAVPGAALRIDFEPFAIRPVPLPEGLAVVVASSGEDAPKGGAARDAYNERVVGARLAAAMLSEQIGFEPGNPPRLRDVWGADAVEILVDDLPEKISVREVTRSVGIDAGVLARFDSGAIDTALRVPTRRPARHILSEADRVEAAEAALTDGDIEAFGRLLNESHESLRNDFKC